MTLKQWLRLAPLLLLFIITLMLSLGLFNSGMEKTITSPLMDKTIPDFNVPLLEPVAGATFNPEGWRGQVVVLNVFASWCEPCIAEHAVLMKLAQTGRVNLAGLAWKDSPENIKVYLTKNGNPFKIIGVDTPGDTTVKLGLTGIPETFVLDQKGTVVYSTKQPLTEELAAAEIFPLVEKLQGHMPAAKP